jgi:hypothetical protein
MHIGGEDIENLLLHIVLKKKILKDKDSKKSLLAFLLGNIWAKHILIWNC